MSRGSELVKNTFVLAIGSFLPKLASFITLPILTGYLLKSEYGTYDLVTILVSLVLPIVTLQIQAAAFRFLIEVRDKNEDIKRIVSNIFAFVIPVSMVSIVVIYFAMYKIPVLTRLCICIYFLFDILVSVARQVIRGIGRNKKYSISAIISSLGMMVGTIIFVYFLRLGLIGAIIALLLAEVLSFFYLWFCGPIFNLVNFNYVENKLLKELLGYSWPLVPNSLSMWIMRVSDRVVVTVYMGVSANAIYSVANKIPQILTIAQSTLTMAWQENASVASKDGDAEKYYSSMFRIMFDFMAGCFGLIIASTPLLFSLLIRGDYDESYYQIPILFLGMFFFSISSYLGGIYVALKKSKNVGITTVFAAICNLIVDLCLIKYIGLYAASGSTLISYFLLMAYRMKDLKKYINMKYACKHLFLVGIILIIESLMCLQRTMIFNILNILLGTVAFVVLNKAIIIAMIEKIKRKINMNNMNS